MSNDHGRASRETGSEGIRDLWRIAGELNAQKPPGTIGEYVPWRCILVKKELLPREHQNADAEERYALAFDELPPVLVQKDTFLLIDGYHRLCAAPKAWSDCVRIVEMDISDAEVWEWAFVENREHGVPLTQAERVKAAKRALKAHPDWSDARIAQWASVDQSAVYKWRGQQEQHAIRMAANDEQSTPVTSPLPDRQEVDSSPAPRLGRDGRVLNTANIGRAAGSAATRFHPAPKPTAPNGRASRPARVMEPRTGEIADTSDGDGLPRQFASALQLDAMPGARDLAESLPPELVSEQIATVKRWIAWYGEYLTALQARQRGELSVMETVGVST